MTALDFGSLNEVLARNVAAENLSRSVDRDYRDLFGAPELDVDDGVTRNLLRSAGPISDAYILGHEPVMLITGPGGSGKTTASVKKACVEAQRIRPGPGGLRRYVLGVWRQKYVNLWKATIPSWWKILPKDLPGSKWVGAPPRDATHTVQFEDAFGLVQLVTHFRAFGDVADPEELLGNEFTDCYLNEMSTLPEELFIALVDRVGREPPYEIIRRHGRFFGDSNAPDVLNYCYRDFYEKPKDGYRLYRQPGGLDPHAENIEAMGRGYYEHSAKINAHRVWWVRRMVDAKPGFTRANDPVYPAFDDERNVSVYPLDYERQLPVLVGVDGGLTPAAVYCQERRDGQLRILREIAIERGGMRELATAMLALEASDFPDATLVTRCDPAMVAGEDTEEGSDRSRLADYLSRSVEEARTQEPDARFEAVRTKLRHTVEGGRPGLLLDPSCIGLRRGFNQTYAFRNIQGTNDRGSLVKTFDSHVHDALQYAALQCGTAQAQRLAADIRREREALQARDRNRKRYDPLHRWRASR